MTWHRAGSPVAPNRRSIARSVAITGYWDDFITEEFAMRVDSITRDTRLPDGSPGRYLEPSLDHLVSCMLGVIEKDNWRRQAAQAVANHVLPGNKKPRQVSPPGLVTIGRWIR